SLWVIGFKINTQNFLSLPCQSKPNIQYIGFHWSSPKTHTVDLCEEFQTRIVHRGY
ncbi:MAG: hypothetical protein RLZ75_581, partial [Pseudomonadota bacterium]